MASPTSLLGFSLTVTVEIYHRRHWPSRESVPTISDPAPKVPQDLTHHNCINLRLPTRGGLYVWEFEKDGQELRVRVEGQMTCNGITQILAMAIDGFGLGFVPDGLANPEIEAGRLVQVLGDWCASYSGYHLYYPSRRQPSAAFTVVVDALRERR